MFFDEALVHMRQDSGMTQQQVITEMARRGYKISSSLFSRFENGHSTPSSKEFLALCDIYHVDDVMGTFYEDYQVRLNPEGLKKVREYTKDLIASGRYLPRRTSSRKIKLYLLPASAGTGQFLDDDNYEMIDVDETVPMSADYGIRVAGDSMEPRYHDGDIVWVEKQEELDEDEIGVFFLNGDSYIKKLHLGKRGTQLISLNENYAPIEIRSSDSFRVFGRVVG